MGSETGGNSLSLCRLDWLHRDRAHGRHSRFDVRVRHVDRIKVRTDVEHRFRRHDAPAGLDGDFMAFFDGKVPSISRSTSTQIMSPIMRVFRPWMPCTPGVEHSKSRMRSSLSSAAARSSKS